MIHYTALNHLFDNLEYQTVRTNKKVNYINLPCGFDIETTSYKQGEEKTAFMYIWQLGIGHDTGVYYGRKWEDFISACEMLQNHFELSDDNRLVIYVHNLGYEFQFMRHYFEWLEVFAVDERKPIKAFCSYGIEFRDSYILSGYSLANTAKNLAKYKVEKLIGDLDYSLIRHHETPLTDKEVSYCKNDIQIITAYISEQIEQYSDVTKIPMTNTGRVRKYVKHECYFTDKSHKKSSKGKFYRYRKIMKDLTIDPDNYVQMKRAFMGGFTHANANYSGHTLTGVSSIDFTSSYPSVMISEKFPMSRFRGVEVESLDKFYEMVKKYALIFNVKFTNFRCKIPQETYISESKCFNLVKPVLNNGRIFSAEELATTITEIDFDIISKVYEWDSIQVSNVKMAYKNYLPKAIIKSILDLYKDKTVLKGVEGYEVEYMLSKGMLNSIYGMSVTDIVKDNAIYIDDWDTEKVDLEEEIKKYNDSMNRFLYYPWGLWVTAYARRNLWSGILAVGNDYVYSDTDSLKLLNYEKHKPYIEWFDNQIIYKMREMCRFYNFDYSLLSPKTKHGEPKTMGIWDYEGTYSRFKTLGAKRYMTEENGEIKITVAGLSKQNGVTYMREQANNDPVKVFEMFNDSLYVPAERTGKMTHTYIDHELKFKVQDYQGSTETVNPLSGVHLESCDFTLSIAEHYKQFLRNFSQGYIYKGVKHV